MEEVVVKELFFNPSVSCDCNRCDNEIPVDVLKIRINKDLSDDFDDFERMAMQTAITSSQLATPSKAVGGIGKMFSASRKSKPTRQSIPKDFKREIICTKCFFEVIKEKKEINEHFEREVNNWIKANEGRLLAKKL